MRGGLEGLTETEWKPNNEFFKRAIDHFLIPNSLWESWV